MRALFQLIARLLRRKPSPKVSKPAMTKNSRGNQQSPTPEPPPNKPQKESRFWRDHLNAENDKRAAFRERYRSRLEEQAPDLGPER